MKYIFLSDNHFDRTEPLGLKSSGFKKNILNDILNDMKLNIVHDDQLADSVKIKFF